MTPNNDAKAFFTLGAHLVKQGEEAMSDGKFNFPQDVLSFFDEGMEAANVVPKFKSAKDQLVNADDESRADVIKHIQTVFELENDKAEKKFEAGLAILTYGSAFFS